MLTLMPWVLNMSEARYALPARHLLRSVVSYPHALTAKDYLLLFILKTGIQYCIHQVHSLNSFSYSIRGRITSPPGRSIA